MAEVNVDVLRIDTSQATSSMGNLRKELKDTRQRMVELRMAGKETSEEYKNLAQRAGDLSRAMRLASTDIQEASTTFSNTVKYVSGSLAGVSGAVQACTGALSLMGVEMGSDTKLMKMLVAAMSITSGLQAIQTSVEAFKKLTTNIKRSTLAQQGLNAAMKANPAMFVVAGIMALTTALAAYMNSVRKAENAQFELNKELQKQNDLLYEAQKLAGKKTAELYLEDVERRKKILKAQGKSELEATKQSQEEIEGEIKKHQDRVHKALQQQRGIEELVGGYQNLTGYYQYMWNEQQKVIDEANSVITPLTEQNSVLKEQINLLEIEANTQAKVNAAKQAQTDKEKSEAQRLADEKQLSAIELSLKTQKEQELQILGDKYKNELALLEKYGKDTKALTEKYNKDVAEINKKYADQEEADRKQKAEENINEHKLELDREYWQKRLEILESGSKDMDQKLQELELTSYQNELIILKEQYDNQLITAEEFETQKLNLEAEYSERRIQLKENEKNAKIAIEKEYLQSIQTISSSIGGIIGSLAGMMEEDAEETKNLKAAEAIINTYAGAVAAFMGITESTGGWGIAAAIAQAAAVLAAGFAQVHQIYKVDTSGGKNTTATTNPAAVSTLTQNYSNTRLLANGGGVYDLSNLAEENKTNQKVYVLTQDIQKGLNQVNVTKKTNSF